MPASTLAPRAPRWFAATLVTALLSAAAFTALSWRAAWRPGRPFGLAFGILATLLFLNAALYPWRRRLRARPLGTVQRWLQFHVYGSALGLLFVFLHMGQLLPNGVMGWLLLGLATWTVATGVAGVWIQRLGPAVLSRRVSIDAIYERIPELVQGLTAEADALMTGAPDKLSRVYTGNIRPLLSKPAASLGSITGMSRIEGEMQRALTEARRLVGETEADRLRDLGAIVADKAGLDTNLSVQRLLRWWLVVHVPPAMILMGLLAVHIVAVIRH